MTRATFPVSGTHHNAPTQHGPQTLNYSTVHRSLMVRLSGNISLLYYILKYPNFIAYLIHSTLSVVTVPGSDCGILQFPVNVTKNVTTTTLGSTATYQCRDGLTPSDTHTTQCTSGGVWEPDPSALTCREPGTQ